MKILVTGARGLIGSAISTALAAQHTLYTTDLANASAPGYFPCDLSDPSSVSGIIPDDCDLIVHCAAIFPKTFDGSQASLCAAKNRMIDDNMISLATKRGAKVIFISSVSLYAPQSEIVLTEHSPVLCQNDYSEEKYNTEQILFSRFPDNSCIFRLSSPYGAGQQTFTVMKLFIDNGMRGEDIYYFGTGSRSQNFIHVFDIRSAVVSAIEQGLCGVYNLAAEETISMKQLALTVQKQLQECRGIHIHVGKAEKDDPQEGQRSMIDITKLKQASGWAPCTGIEDGISDWIRNYP